MKKLLVTSILSLAAGVAFGQANTNLSAQMNAVWQAMPLTIQQSTLDTWADYQKAGNRSSEFRKVTTNTVVTVEGGITNSVTTVTTNNPAMTFVQWYQAGLAQEKVARVVQQRNDAIRQEMYHAVGKTVVDSW